MNEQTRALVAGVKLAVMIVFGLVALFVIGTFAWPWILNASESVFGFRVTPEKEIRAIIWFVLLLCALVMLFVRKISGRPIFTSFSGLFILTIGILTPIFLWDKMHLKDEMSWIRYPTAIFLSLTAVGLWLASRRFNDGEKLPKAKEWIWMLIALGMLYAAADEILQVHEIIGGFVERTFHVPHVFTDLLTGVYGLIGLGVLLYALRALRPVWDRVPRLFVMTFVAGITFFIISTIFDTFDIFVWNGIDRFIDVAYDGGSTVVPDIMHFWYAPNLLLNGFEEVFEMFAGLLFAFGAWTMFRSFSVDAREVSRMQRRAAWSVAAVTAIALVVPSFFAASLFSTPSPFEDGTPATVLASRPDGMYHTDDLAYDEKLGLLIGNESRADYEHKSNGPGVFNYKDGAVSRVPDPDNLLKNTDSVTAMDGKIYATDTYTGTLNVFDATLQKFVRVAGREQGLKVPEALAPYNGDLYVVDEHFKSIAKITKDGTVTQEALKHPLWDGPEDIVYVPALEAFLITDDRTGAIFRYVPNKEFSVWSDISKGMKNPESIAVYDDTHVILTDTKLGAILLLNLDGTIARRFQLRYQYSDVEGVAVDENKNIYFVTADAFESVAAMPSTVWIFRI